MPGSDTVTTLLQGGTTAFILALIIAVVSMVTEVVVSGRALRRAEDREIRALASGEKAVAATERIADEFAAYRQLTERMWSELKRGER